MHFQNVTRLALALGLTSVLSACGGGGWFGGTATDATGAQLTQKQRADAQRARIEEVSNAGYEYGESDGESSVFDLFSGGDNPNTTVEVNKYIWQASLEVLNFLPIESVDPFSGRHCHGLWHAPRAVAAAYRATDLCAGPRTGRPQSLKSRAAVTQWRRHRSMPGDGAGGRGCDSGPRAAAADSRREPLRGRKGAAPLRRSGAFTPEYFSQDEWARGTGPRHFWPVITARDYC